MSLIVESERRNAVVTFLSDVDIEFVSVVKHPANRTPRRLVKEEGSEDMQKADNTFDESKHPRADNGEFTSGSGGGGIDAQGRASRSPLGDKVGSFLVDNKKNSGLTMLGLPKKGNGIVVLDSKDNVTEMSWDEVAKHVTSLLPKLPDKEKQKANQLLDEISKQKNTKGDAMSFEVIHQIIQPVGRDITSLKALYGEEWFEKVNLDEKVESDLGTRYIQKAEDAFDGLPFILKDAGHGLMFSVGKLGATLKADDSCLLVPTQLKADTTSLPTTVGNLSPDPMDVPIAQGQDDSQDNAPDMMAPYPMPADTGPKIYTFRDLFCSKSAALQAGVASAMELNGDAVKRRASIRGFLDDYVSFIMAALDQVDAGTVKNEMGETVETAETDIHVDSNSSKSELTPEPENQSSEGEIDMGFFETKEEMADFFKETMTPVIQATVKAELEAAKPPETDADKAAKLSAKVDELTAALETTKSELDALTTKTEGLSHATTRGQTAREEDGQDPLTTKAETVSAWGSIRPRQTSNISVQ